MSFPRATTGFGRRGGFPETLPAAGPPRREENAGAPRGGGFLARRAGGRAMMCNAGADGAGVGAVGWLVEADMWAGGGEGAVADVAELGEPSGFL